MRVADERHARGEASGGDDGSNGGRGKIIFFMQQGALYVKLLKFGAFYKIYILKFLNNALTLRNSCRVSLF